MIKQVLLPIIGVMLFIVAVGLFVQKSGSIKSPNTNPSPTPSTITVGGKDVQVTLAKTKEERAEGLSGTKSLNENSGLLFVFNPKANPVFWMKDMLIPLDIIWIDKDKIVKINKNVPIPQPNTPDNKLPTYSAGQLVEYVLEVNAGFTDDNNIRVGDVVEIKL